jgi:hypothetical protein
MSCSFTDGHSPAEIDCTSPVTFGGISTYSWASYSCIYMLLYHGFHNVNY